MSVKKMVQQSHRSPVLLGLAFLSIVTVTAEATTREQVGEQVQLQITVEGAASDAGRVLIAILDSESEYDSENGKAVATAVWPVHERKAAGYFALPPGEYAVRLFHDENDNGEFDTNFLGIPLESYGFSNNVYAPFGPPSFQRAKVELQSGVRDLTINLR